MAPGMRWPLATGLSCAVVALLAVRSADRSAAIRMSEPIDDESGNRRWTHPIVQRVWALNDELDATRIARDEQAAFDSGYAAVPMEPSIVLQRRPPMPIPASAGDTAWLRERQASRDSVARAFEDSLRVAQAATPSRARVALREVLLPMNAELPYWSFVDAEVPRFFAGRDEHGAYCFGTFPHVASVSDQPLGPCRMWARYGAPSPAVLAWLEHSGHLLEYEAPRAEEGDRFFFGPYGFRPGEELEAAPRRRLFGIRTYQERRDYIQLNAQACLAGREDGCLEAALDPDSWRFGRTSLPSRALQNRARFTTLGTIGGFFGDIERELGPAEFERFWTSAVEPEAELRAALGSDLDAWTHRWLVAHFGREPLGPRVPAASLLMSLLAIAALVGASIAVATRRRIA